MKYLPLLLLIPASVGSTRVNIKSPPIPPPIGDSSITVTLTTYQAVPGQTDDNPFETASGYKLNRYNPRKHRIIAVSRDLLKEFNFADSVVIENAGKYSGTYCVHDVMNKRFRKRIDVLINRNQKGTLLNNVKIKLK